MTARIETVAVVVPAADEETLLPGCLDALSIAREAVGGVAVRVLVVLDACTDRSAAIVAAAPGVEALPVAFRRVGAARAAGCRAALADVADPARLWLATTDADSRVPPDWLVGMLGHARAGADLVLGTVRPDADSDAPLLAEWRRRYTDRDGHRHVHGANLGLRGDVYTALSGWAPVAFDEDVDLVRRVEALGNRHIVRSAAIPVRTSVRRDGRAPHGFASWLRGIDALTDLDPAG